VKEKVEILQLPDTPYDSDADALFATQCAGLGDNVGLLHGAKAMAPAHDGASFLILEEINQRISAFNVNGVVVPYFAGGTATSAPLVAHPEDAGKTITYIDMCLESTGFIYVLSYAGAGTSPSDYRLDIYEPEGEFLSRTSGVAAAKLVVDNWRVVYTLNYQLLTGANQRPEPSVSEWVANAV
jgi:hypothetical protein